MDAINFYLTMWGKYTVFEKLSLRKFSVVYSKISRPYWAAGFAASGWTGKDRSGGGSLLQLASVRQRSEMIRYNLKAPQSPLVCVLQAVDAHHLCNPGQLSAEVGQSGVLLRLNISVKLWLDLPCGCVQENSRKLNCKEKKEGIHGGCYQQVRK